MFPMSSNNLNFELPPLLEPSTVTLMSVDEHTSSSSSSLSPTRPAHNSFIHCTPEQRPYHISNIHGASCYVYDQHSPLETLAPSPPHALPQQTNRQIFSGSTPQQGVNQTDITGRTLRFDEDNSNVAKSRTASETTTRFGQIFDGNEVYNANWLLRSPPTSKNNPFDYGITTTSILAMNVQPETNAIPMRNQSAFATFCNRFNEHRTDDCQISNSTADEIEAALSADVQHLQTSTLECYDEQKIQRKNWTFDQPNRNADDNPSHVDQFNDKVIHPQDVVLKTITFACAMCPKTYTRQASLRAHLRQHVHGETFSCPYCHRAFAQATNLNAHLRVHTGEKPFACNICGRPFSQSSSLATHRRTHTGEKPYGCKICGRQFADSSTLAKHTRTHTGDKPYKCAVCCHRFSQSGNLNRHAKSCARKRQQMYDNNNSVQQNQPPLG